MALKPIAFTEDEVKAIGIYISMAEDTYSRKAKDPRQPEGVQKHYHDGIKFARALKEKLQAGA